MKLHPKLLSDFSIILKAVHFSDDRRNYFQLTGWVCSCNTNALNSLNSFLHYSGSSKRTIQFFICFLVKIKTCKSRHHWAGPEMWNCGFLLQNTSVCLAGLSFICRAWCTTRFMEIVYELGNFLIFGIEVILNEGMRWMSQNRQFCWVCDWYKKTSTAFIFFKMPVLWWFLQRFWFLIMYLRRNIKIWNHKYVQENKLS